MRFNTLHTHRWLCNTAKAAGVGQPDSTRLFLGRNANCETHEAWVPRRQLVQFQLFSKTRLTLHRLVNYNLHQSVKLSRQTTFERQT